MAPTETANPTPKRVMSGMRSTGRLHLGHYVGVLKNWLALQDQYPCYFMIADWHALTTLWDNPDALIAEYVFDVALDWLAVGIDPTKAKLYVQSHVPQIAELHLLLSMITPNKWVETDPTLKDMVAMADSGLTYGLLGYPILQTADILLPKGALVPVGKDQIAHLEISRQIATRFNDRYGAAFFPEPQHLLTETPMLPGLDGRKMGKSYGNAIYLADSEDETWQKLRQGITDPQRVKRDDPGDPEKCDVIFQYYRVFMPPEAQALADSECRSAARGCMDCKKVLADVIMDMLRPIRQNRAELADNKDYVWSMLKSGAESLRDEGDNTLTTVRKALRLPAV